PLSVPLTLSAFASVPAAHTCLPPTPSLFFFFKDTATPDIYTLSLHDALPICPRDDTAFPSRGREGNHRRGSTGACLAVGGTRSRPPRHRPLTSPARGCGSSPCHGGERTHRQDPPHPLRRFR